MLKKGMKKNVYRWYVFGILCISYLIVNLHRLSVGTVQGDLIEEFNISQTTIANLGSMYFYAYILMQIPTGILADTIGPRITVTIGSVVAGLGSIVFGFAPSIEYAYLGRFLVGIGVSVTLISLLKIITEWYSEKQFATMSGLTVFTGNMGSMLAQTPLILLVSILTWRYTFVAIGTLSVALSILCFLIVRNKPSDKYSISTFENIKSTNTTDAKTQKINEPKESIQISKALSSVLKNPHTWPPAIAFGCFYGAFYSMGGAWGQGYLRDIYEISKLEAGNNLVIMLFGYTISGMFIGILSDKLCKRKLPLLAFSSVYLVCWGIIVFYNHGEPPKEFLSILFFMLGFSASMIPVLFAVGKEVNNPRFSGITTSFINMCSFLGVIILNYVIGNIMESYTNVLSQQLIYQKVFFCCFISVAIGFIFVLFIKETKATNIFVLKTNNKI